MSEKTQSYEKHARFVPLYHFVLFGILVLNLVHNGFSLIKTPSASTFLGLLMAVAFLIMFFYIRVFPLTAQDRLICLEERLRLQQQLPDDLRARIAELRPGQLIALRFASDSELPELVREILAQGLQSRKEIKARIKNWRPDNLRV